MKMNRLNMLLTIVLTVVPGFVSIAASADHVVVIPLSSSAAPAVSKLVFVTNGTWNGDLGGLAGADAKCNAEAKSRNFPGTFQALLGSGEGRPEHRSIHYPLPYVTITGESIQSGYHDLFNNGPDTPILPDPPHRVWTGLASKGNLSGDDCNGWTDDGSDKIGTGGRADQPKWWLDDGLVSNCSVLLPLYCLEQ